MRSPRQWSPEIDVTVKKKSENGKCGLENKAGMTIENTDLKAEKHIFKSDLAVKDKVKVI